MAKKWTKFPHADASFAYAGPALKKAWNRLHQGDREAYPKSVGVVDAWRHFHAGAFQEAVAAGRATGEGGINAAIKAQCVYANYVEPDEWADERRTAAPRDANSHYLYAFALGRYGQGISVAKALAQGFGGKIRDALMTALSLDPMHAEAATAFGTYQAEVIDKVGGLVAGLTYGRQRASSG